MGINGQTRRLLLFGFGGLLLLLAFTGVTALSIVKRIQMRGETIREDYFARVHILEQLRSDIYLSGTYVRDLLLEPDPNRANIHCQELQEAERRINGNIAAYDRILRPEERDAFRRFTAEVASYFSSLSPTLEWTAAQRRAFGYGFMTSSLLPRRMTIVHIADQLGAVNQEQVEASNRHVKDLFLAFRRLLVSLLVLTLVCGAGLAAGSILRILRLERLSAVRFEEVEHARTALRDLSARLITAQEADRRALSRELHDEIGQSLSALLLGLGNVSAVLSPDGDAGARAQLRDLRRLTEQTVAAVRDLSLLLRPSMLDDLGLIPALEWQAREVSRTSNISVRVEAANMPENFPEEHKTCIYRIVQESLRNVVRHARAKNVLMRLEHSRDELTLTIQDDGNGFVPEREKGLGLLGMEERVAHLHGSFRVESAPGAGTSVRIELPLIRSDVAVAV